MNTLWTPLNTVQLGDSVARLNMWRTCGLMLALLLVLPAHAQRAITKLQHEDLQINNMSQSVKPLAATAPPAAAQPVPGNLFRPQGGVTQGEGPATPRTQVASVAPPMVMSTLVAAPLPPPPMPGAGNTGTAMDVATPSPPNKQMPGPGRGPEKPVMPGAGVAPEPSPTARTMVPSGPTPGTGPTIANSIQPSSLLTTNAPPNAPIGLAQPVPPMQGNPVADMQPVPAAQSNPRTVAMLSPTGAPSATSLVEILPGVQKLSESMRELPAVGRQGDGKNTATAANSNKCISVSLRPDTQRPGTSLVDLTGDGLIVSAVPDHHIQAVFAKEGYAQPDLSQTARWCITQTAARALVRPTTSVGVQQASLLVKTDTGLQLMSHDQWVAHQTSINPSAMVMASSKPSQLNKTTHKLVAKRSGKAAAGIAVSALRLPAGSPKTSAGA